MKITPTNSYHSQQVCIPKEAQVGILNFANKLNCLKENNNPNAQTKHNIKDPNTHLHNPIKTSTSLFQHKALHQLKQPFQLKGETKGCDLTHMVYEKEIMKYVKTKEGEFMINHKYLNSHHGVNMKSRKSFVKHFFKISRAFKLRRKTIFLAVYYMDCYFSKNHYVERLNAVAIAEASLFIAMKYEEIYPPELSEWSEEPLKIIEAESEILFCLNFKLEYPSVETYLQYYFSKLHLTDSQIHMIQLIADVTLFDESMYCHNPCELSSAIIYSIANRNKLDSKMAISLTSMLERNEKFMDWLQIGTMNAAISH